MGVIIGWSGDVKFCGGFSSFTCKKYENTCCYYVDVAIINSVTSYTHQEFIDQLKEKNPEVVKDFKFLDEYHSKNRHMQLECIKHGTIHKCLPRDLTFGNYPTIRSCRKEDKEKYYLSRFKEQYDSKYKYDDFVFSTSKQKLGITCPIHGKFEQQLTMHNMGRGCPKCGNQDKWVEVPKSVVGDLDGFIKEVYKKNPKFLENYDILSYGVNNTDCQVLCKNYDVIHRLKSRAIIQSKCVCSIKSCDTPEKLMQQKLFEVHGNTLDFSNAKYSNSSKDDIIGICPEHGEVRKRYTDFLSGRGCEACGGSKKKNSREYKKQAKELHGDKFNYQKTKYVDCKTKLVVTCPQHGDFSILPKNHLRGYGGCVGCFKERQSHTHEEFIEKLAEVNPQLLENFDIVNEYKGINSTMKIQHKEEDDLYEITANNLLSAVSPTIQSACDPTGMFIARSKKIHGNLYDYTDTIYKNYKTPTTIICKEHGVFEQSPSLHLNGSGCPKCASNVSKGEKHFQKLLIENDISYQAEKRYIDCKHIYSLPFDFYLDDYNTLVEIDGMQHYRPVNIFGGEDGFLKRQKIDQIKTEFCDLKGIDLLRIVYDPNTVESREKFYSECKRVIERVTGS